MHKNSLVVIDFGSQYNQLIVRRVRECGVYAELVSPAEAEGAISRLDPAGIILSGGPAGVGQADAPHLPPVVLQSGLPVLGICYGMQLLAHDLGGEVRAAEKCEYGFSDITVTAESPLFKGIPKESHCWMSHGDTVVTLPTGFTTLASTPQVAHAAMGGGGLFGVQFHPEVSHTPWGRAMIRNFLSLCGCTFQWTPNAMIDEAVNMIREKVGEGRALCAVSGGVDSTVAAILADRALGSKLHCVFVDNGLLRKDEALEVASALKKLLKGNLHVVNGVEQFLTSLAGVTDPEEKRRIIGEQFIRRFEEVASSIEGLQFLIQGTLYPDVIESSGRGRNGAARIKSHHNVGGLPENLSLTIVEPLRFLFKDEVRTLGESLGVPKSMLLRQPFPGPGLAVRIIGEVTGERLDLLRHADDIVVSEITKAGDGGLWQFFPVFLPLRSVGVMGDQRSYAHMIGIRVVTSEDGMTCDWARLPYDLLNRMSLRIVNEVKGVNRVLYDITSKPPATIEWE